MTPIKVDVLNI